MNYFGFVNVRNKKAMLSTFNSDNSNIAKIKRQH